MKIFFKFFGMILSLVGIWLLIQPNALFGWIENNLESRSLYISAILIRLIIGTLLLFAAKETKYPNIMRFIGFLAITAAVIFIFIGQARFQEFISSLLESFKSFAPVSGLICIAIGAFLIYAFIGKEK